MEINFITTNLPPIEKGDLLSLPSRITNPVGDNSSPLGFKRAEDLPLPPDTHLKRYAISSNIAS